MADYKNLRINKTNAWVFLGEFVSIMAGAIDSGQGFTSSAAFKTWLNTNIPNAPLGTIYYALNINTFNYLHCEMDGENNIIENLYFNGTALDCLVMNGTIVFGKMPTISITSTYYNEANDSVRIQVSANKTWGTGTWTYWYDINDTSPDYSTNAPATQSTGYLYIYNARSIFGTGTKTCYTQVKYGTTAYSNLASASVLISRPLVNPTITVTSYTQQKIYFTIKNNDSVGANFYYEAYDNSPDLNQVYIYGNSTSATLNVDIFDGTGVVYVQGVSNTIGVTHSDVVASSVPIVYYQWGYVAQHTSQVVGDVNVQGYYDGDMANAVDDLIDQFPPSDQGLGDIGVAWDLDNNVWYEFQVEEM